MNLPSNAPEQTTSARVRDNIFFPLLIACGGMFCLTTLILVVCSFDTSGSQKVVFFEQNAGWMIFIEMGVTILVGILALVVDRRRTLASMSANRSLTPEAPADVEAAGPGKDGR